MNQFTKSLYLKINNKDEESLILEYINEQIKNKISNKNYLEVDQILSEIIIEKLSNKMILAFLQETLGEENWLESRYDFYKDAEKILSSRNKTHDKE